MVASMKVPSMFGSEEVGLARRMILDRDQALTTAWLETWERRRVVWSDHQSKQAGLTLNWRSAGSNEPHYTKDPDAVERSRKVRVQDMNTTRKVFQNRAQTV
jgi:hypothetical protein